MAATKICGACFDDVPAGAFAGHVRKCAEKGARAVGCRASVAELFIEDLDDPAVLDAIADGVYLGSGRAVGDDAATHLAAHAIKAIVNAADNIPTPPAAVLEAVGLDASAVHRLELQDDFDFDPREAFVRGADLVAGHRSAGRNVLVHCAVGASRSASIVLAYLMTSGGLSLFDALRVTRSKRPIVSPNIGFLLRLLALEASLRGTISIPLAALQLHRQKAALSQAALAPLLAALADARFDDGPGAAAEGKGAAAAAAAPTAVTSAGGSSAGTPAAATAAAVGAAAAGGATGGAGAAC